MVDGLALIRGELLASFQQLGQPLAYRVVPSAICQQSARGAFSRQILAGFLLCQPQYANGRPNHCAKCQESPMD
jgi:hypothetical protein